jgi:hypothetical protein
MLRGAAAIKTNKMTQCVPAINALCFYINLSYAAAMLARSISKGFFQEYKDSILRANQLAFLLSN